MEIQVEINKKYFSDSLSDINKICRNIETQMISNLGVGAKITLKAPGSIVINGDKVKRIVDNRKV